MSKQNYNFRFFNQIKSLVQTLFDENESDENDTSLNIQIANKKNISFTKFVNNNIDMSASEEPNKSCGVSIYIEETSSEDE